MISKSNKKYYLFLCIFYIVIFRDLCSPIIPLLDDLDEVYALIAIPLFIYKIFKNMKAIIKKNTYSIWIFIFILVGLLSSICYHYQPLIIVIHDLVINLKFWLAIYVSLELFKGFDLYEHSNAISKHIKLVIWIYIMLILLDNLSGGIFPAAIRYGMRSTQLFYGAHTVFCATCVFILSILSIIQKETKNTKFYQILILILIGSTLRSKAFGAIILYIIMYYYIYIKEKRLKISNIIGILVACILVGWSQIEYYFFSEISDGAARNLLLKYSFHVANDHFPLGSGFGTYASYYSGVSYSPLYERYGLSGVWGLTRNYPAFISDTFWPMLIAQFGYIGLSMFVIALYKLFVQIGKLKSISKDYYLGVLFCFGYLCISSMAETAFCGYISIPFAFIIGISLNQIDIIKE